MPNGGRLLGEVAIVTAGGQGIGEAIAKTFAREGATVAVVDINGKEAGRVVDEIAADGGKAFALTVERNCTTVPSRAGRTGKRQKKLAAR